MKNQLLEIFKLQEELDRDILEKHNIKEYPLEKINVALFTELGELMNEQQELFKYWKSSAKNNREKALEEYVDCIHFMTSITIHSSDDYEKSIKAILKKYELPFMVEMKYSTLLFETSHIGYCPSFRYASLLRLGKELGFTWDEIYEAYKKKNGINHQRQEENY